LLFFFLLLLFLLGLNILQQRNDVIQVLLVAHAEREAFLLLIALVDDSLLDGDLVGAQLLLALLGLLLLLALALVLRLLVLLRFALLLLRLLLWLGLRLLFLWSLHSEHENEEQMHKSSKTRKMVEAQRDRPGRMGFAQASWRAAAAEQKSVSSLPFSPQAWRWCW
jgi:membrane protein implicated in regulation of membrane protease activity